jgi:hypothetical protein
MNIHDAVSSSRLEEKPKQTIKAKADVGDGIERGRIMVDSATNRFVTILASTENECEVVTLRTGRRYRVSKNRIRPRL